MTSYEQLKDLLERERVPYSHEAGYTLGPVSVNERSPGDTIMIEADADTAKVDGYTGFFVIFSFREDGSLVQMGVYE